MAPARNRATQEDSKAEGVNGKDKGNSGQVGKGKKVAASAQTSNNKEAAATASSSTNTAQTSNAFIDWDNEDLSLLLKYRFANRLKTESAFQSQENAAVLSVPGIGRHSPTMARKRAQKVAPKEQLAVVVRRHYHGLPMNEQQAIADLITAVKNRDKVFKRFPTTQ